MSQQQTKKKKTLDETWSDAVFNRNRSGYQVWVKRWEPEDDIFIDFLSVLHQRYRRDG